MAYGKRLEHRREPLQHRRLFQLKNGVPVVPLHLDHQYGPPFAALLHRLPRHTAKELADFGGGHRTAAASEEVRLGPMHIAQALQPVHGSLGRLLRQISARNDLGLNRSAQQFVEFFDG